MTSRRSALKTLALGLLAACDSVVARFKGARFTPIVDASRVTSDAAYRTTVAEQPIIVVRDASGVRTFVALCTHEGCPLGWNATQHLIRCPCHGSAFSTAGQVVEGPAQLPLTEIATRVEGGSVTIDERALAVSRPT
ncbi:MAG: ubiquinol-cytochrome c reductase iron-sulfur subunit [bacterium]